MNCSGKSSGKWTADITWWRHQMKTFSALLAICARTSPVPGKFPAQRPVTRSFDVFFDLRLNKRLSKQSCGWWFETPPCPLWRHCNDRVIRQIFGWMAEFMLMLSRLCRNTFGHNMIDNLCITCGNLLLCYQHASGWWCLTRIIFEQQFLWRDAEKWNGNIYIILYGGLRRTCLRALTAR